MVKKNGNKSLVSVKEYEMASSSEKRLINQIDATIAFLDFLRCRETHDLTAILSVSLNENEDFLFSLHFATINDENQKRKVLRTCIICGPVSAYNCVKLINNCSTIEKKCNIQIKNLDNFGVVLLW